MGKVYIFVFLSFSLMSSAQLYTNGGRVQQNVSKTNNNVGIGTDNPHHKLTVQGSSYSTEHTIQADSPLLILQRNTNQGGYLQGIQTRLQNNQNNWYFGNVADERWIVAKGDYTSSLFELYKNGNATLKGKLELKEIKVTNTPTADFVFEESYPLLKLSEVEKFIKKNKHLPEVASAREMEEEGVNVGEFQIKLLQKIEELTLYVIEQEKKIKVLESELKSLKKK